MALEKVVVSNFRNIQQSSFEPGDGINLILGKNGSGKTSLLEAIYFLGLGRSFRTHLTSRVVSYEKDNFVVFAQVNTRSKAVPLGLRKTRGGETELKIDGQAAVKLAQLAEILPIQLIHPEGYDLLTGGPKLRRAFLDWGVFHQVAGFFPQWGRVKRLIKQRNAALKTAANYREIGYWDKELCERAGIISRYRADYLEQLIPKVTEVAQDFLPEFEFDFQFFRGWDKSRELADCLKTSFPREQALGYTTFGPQKADIRIKVNGVPVSDVLSRGQLKLLVCALRLAQGKLHNETGSTKCIFLLDDFTSELDQDKRRPLAKHIAESGAQVFITAIEREQVEVLFGQSNKVFHVEHGKISEL